MAGHHDVVSAKREPRSALTESRVVAPDLLATAKARRWEPAEAMRALLAEELAGRQAFAML